MEIKRMSFDEQADAVLTHAHGKNSISYFRVSVIDKGTPYTRVNATNVLGVLAEFEYPFGGWTCFKRLALQQAEKYFDDLTLVDI